MLHSKSQVICFSICLTIFILFPATHCPPGNNDLVQRNVCTADNSFANAHKILLNKNATRFVHAYIRKNNESLTKIKQRSKLPFVTIDRVFNKYHLPVELKYLAVIESELKPGALSCVGAAGPWQLMPGTAKLLGLKITPAIDERTQYNASTKAAALYLRDLYTEFDDWLLVIAAYNCGPGPVYTAIRKSGSRNFWNLQAYLPQESREHVKKFIATHYYFEGQGSLTTLTRAETIRRSNEIIALKTGDQLKVYAAMKLNPARERAGAERKIVYGL